MISIASPSYCCLKCCLNYRTPFFKCPLTSKSGTLPYSFVLHTGQCISLFSVNSHKRMACKENIRPNEALPRVAEWGNWDGAQRYTAMASPYLKQCRNSAVKAVHCMKVSPPPLRSFALQIALTLSPTLSLCTDWMETIAIPPPF